MDKPEVKIEQWWVAAAQDMLLPFDLSPNDDGYHFLHGVCTGHPRLSDGTHIHTSYVVNFDWKNGRVETRNSIYILGAPRKASQGLALRIRHPQRIHFMGDKGESMTSIEILETLYNLVEDRPDGLRFVTHCGTHCGLNGVTAEEYVSQDDFWLELDDALAKRGWRTDLRNSTHDSAAGFHYTATYMRRLHSECEKDGVAQSAKTRNEAVRIVYEQVLKQEQTP